HDVARPLLQHRAVCRPGAVDDTHQVDVDHGAPMVERQVADLPTHTDACVVEHEVHASVSAHRIVDQPLDRRLVPNVQMPGAGEFDIRAHNHGATPAKLRAESLPDA